MIVYQTIRITKEDLEMLPIHLIMM